MTDVQSTIFDAVGARADAEQGMQAALEAERVRMWRLVAADWLENRVIGEQFIADGLVADIGLPSEGVYRNNAVGALFSAWAKAGRIRWTGGMRKSERRIGHGNLQRVWEVIA